MNDLIQLLSERSKPLPPVQVQLEPEGGFKLQRRERKSRLQPNGRPASVNRPREERFKPSAEMLDVRKDIGQTRIHVARAYNRLTLTTGNGMPNFRSLKKFKELVRKVTLLENKYKDIEVVTRKARQTKREAEARKIGEQEEYAGRPFKVPLLKGALLEASADALAAGIISIDYYRDIKAMANL